MAMPKTDTPPESFRIRTSASEASSVLAAVTSCPARIHNSRKDLKSRKNTPNTALTQGSSVLKICVALKSTAQDLPRARRLYSAALKVRVGSRSKSVSRSTSTSMSRSKTVKIAKTSTTPHPSRDHALPLWQYSKVQLKQNIT